MARFEPNPEGIKRAANAAVANMNAPLQPGFDRVHAEMAGRPAGEIEPKLNEVWREKTGSDVPADKLTLWATTISEGKRIVLQVGEPRM